MPKTKHTHKDHSEHQPVEEISSTEQIDETADQDEAVAEAETAAETAETAQTTEPSSDKATAEKKEPVKRTTTTFKLTEAGKEKLSKVKTGGQVQLILGAMNDGANSVNSITAAIGSQLVTKQEPKKVVAFYVTTWRADGVIEDTPGVEEYSVPAEAAA